MATAEEANRERRTAALSAASKLYEGMGDKCSSHEVIALANAFLAWLEKRY